MRFLARVQKAPGTQAHSEEPQVVEIRHVESDWVEKDHEDRPVSLPRSIEVLHQEGQVPVGDVTEQPSTTTNVEAPQLEVTWVGEEVHQLTEQKLAKATANEGAGAVVNSAMLSIPTSDMATSSSQPMEEEVDPVIGSESQLQPFNPELAGLMGFWTKLLNQASIFDGKLRVYVVLSL